MDGPNDYEVLELEVVDTKAPRKQANENRKSSRKSSDTRFEFGKLYRLNEDGTITEQEGEIGREQSQCGFSEEDCCTIKIPKGFRITPGTNPSVCYDASNLKCIKTPVMATVPLPPCSPGDISQCSVVAGYEIRVTGSVTIVASLSVSPISGVCFLGNPSNVGCSVVIPVDSLLAHSCSPAPCPNNNCYRITVYFTLVENKVQCTDLYTMRFFTVITSSGLCQ